jgi:hypothetical protein
MQYFMGRAEKGQKETIRKLAPIAALEDAVGRAIELGRPILTTYSFQDDFSAPTMVGLETVRYVSKEAALKGGKVLVGAGAARTLPVAVENYRLGTLEGGAPELYDDRNVYFFTQQQWAYTTGVIGLMNREKPAAATFIGPFLVEGIHLGITSRRLGTLAIGGNTSYSMGAFMFVTMDYMLLGEEMFAASAYMSGDDVIISNIATEDIVKWIIGIILLVGTLFKLVGSDIIINLLKV